MKDCCPKGDPQSHGGYETFAGPAADWPAGLMGVATIWRNNRSHLRLPYILHG